MANRFWVVRPLPNLDCFRCSALPADLQVQQLWLRSLDDGNIADQQTEDAFAIASRGCRRLPQSRKVLSELQNQLFLFSCDTAHGLAFEMRQLGLQFKHPLHRVVPAFLERTGDEAVAGVSLLIAALCQVGFVAGTLDPSVPLRRDYSVTFLQVSQRCEREFDRQRRDSSQQTFTNRVIKRLCRQAHAVWLQCLAMPPVALVDRVQAAIALIAHR